MMKFFRRYTKHLLAVFMALLLFIWLIEIPLSRMQGGPGAGNPERGVAFGATVRLNDMLPAFTEAQLLDDLTGKNWWRYPWVHILSAKGINQQAMQQYMMQIRYDLLTDTEWYLLDTAARKAGVFVPLDAVERFKTENHIPPQVLDYVRNKNKSSLEDIDRAIQSFLRVRQAAEVAADAIKISEADIRNIVRQTSEQARVTAVAIDVKKYIDATYQPTPDELKSHFDKYKSVASRPSEANAFGYQLPEKAQIEYIEVNVDALAPIQKVTDDDAHEYWGKHKLEFNRPSTRPASTQPATQPEPKIPYDTFFEARTLVNEKVRKDQAKIEAARIARDLIGQLDRSWTTTAATQPIGSTQPAPSQLDAELYPRLIRQFEQKYPGALRYGRTQVLEQQKLSSDPKIGQAMALRDSQQQISAPQAAFLVPGLELTPENKKQHERFVRKLGQSAPEPFVDNDGNAFIIRTVIAEPKKTLDSLDVIRNQLVDDVRKVRAVQEAERQARKLADQAGKDGLEQAFNADAALKLKLGADAFKKPAPFASKRIITFFGPPQMSPASVPGLGYDPELTDKIFALAGKTTTQPHRLVVHEQKREQTWVVIQLIETLPVTRAEYDNERKNAIQLLEKEHLTEVLGNWFSADQIRERTGWKDAEKTPVKDEDKDNPAN